MPSTSTGMPGMNLLGTGKRPAACRAFAIARCAAVSGTLTAGSRVGLPPTLTFSAAHRGGRSPGTERTGGTSGPLGDAQSGMEIGA